MKRDWELIREILIALENLPSTQTFLEPKMLERYDPEIVSYHIQILDEAGLIEGHCHKSLNAPLRCWANRLTWHGHEFLDEIKSDTIWNKTKEVLKEKGIDLSFDTITSGVKIVLESMLLNRQ